ncbi:ABC transporter permease [Oscillibacter ruminantium]|uniref:ABC transporter permease n=1 Tax=Oscillibacter ruminantium TaxID=1263547 RepID=UPI002B1EB4A0|nr:ABC transporter permease [Oscillibacter ruminantium]MEA5041644.1 ABC transporter permease [Oscillibacter ruminantium]
MKIGQALKMALKSILGNKGRSALTMLGIIIGIASVMTIVSTISGMNKKSMEMMAAMGTNKITVSASYNNGRDAFQDLYDYCQKLSDYVDGVTPNSQFSATVVYGAKNSAKMGGSGGMGYYGGGMMVASEGGSGSENTEMPPTLYFGSDQYAICNNFKIAKGRDITLLDIQDYKQVCVLGARAAQTFFNYVDPVGKTMQVNGLPYTVIGVYKEKDPDSKWSMDNIIVFPYTVKRMLAPSTTLTEFSVKAKSSDAAVEATSRIISFLTGLMGQNREKGYFSAQSENQWQQSSNDYATMMSLVMGGIAAISLLVGGIGIMNIMLVTVTERTREIGIRRAIGAERGSIVTQFLIEAAMICGIGGIIGIAIGTLGTRIAGRLLVQMNIWPSLGITLGAFALSVALGILFGIYPAAKASKLQPVEALRAE